MVPRRMREVRTAAAASVAHGSVAQMPSHTKKPCQPCCSAAASASSTASSGSVPGKMNPDRMLATLPRAADTDRRTRPAALSGWLKDLTIRLV